MGLSDIAAGVEVTTEQRDRGVATVDRTEQSLAERLDAVADELPCTGEAAATVVERYTGGGSVGAAARTAAVAPMTAAKALHLLGESVSPVGPTGRDVIDDYLAGELSRTDARQLARVSETEFALAVYVATHDPLPDARAAVEDALAVDTETDPLAETRSETTDLL
ncbi:hypothetical protein [Salinibaculum salinum]|uniref:DUF7858 family protein n=1 Tax=Salinibaculum salinum TaxID=3131996 RepID=UPI0030ECB9C4